jgi:hypothetical protein
MNQDQSSYYVNENTFHIFRPIQTLKQISKTFRAEK